jgi:hypothetical protein
MDLLSLPVEIVTEICANWLTILTIVDLDTAYCSHATRGSFLAVAFSTECSLAYEPEDIDYREKANVWILQRKARVPGLHVTDSLFSATATEYFMSHGKFLEFIFFRSRDTIEGASEETVVENILKFCPHIRRLEANKSLSIDGFIRIVRKCRLLEDVDIDGSKTTPGCVAALNTSPCLRKLAVCYPEQVI